MTQSSQWLPLSSVEQYHLADDSRRFPNVISCDLLVTGKPDSAQALAALRSTTARHLMTCARLESRGWRKPAWHIDTQFADGHRIIEGPTESRFIDLRSSPPGQMIVTDEGDRTRLSFRVHHAAIDGAGGLQVVSDWMQAYHRLIHGTAQPRSRTVDQSLLQKRNNLGLFKRQFLSRLWIQPIAMMGAFKFLLRKVTTVAPLDDSPDGTDEPSPTVQLNIELDALRYGRLREVAAKNRATINELVLHAIFRSIHQLRKERKWHSDGEWIRLVIPMNIRDFADRRMAAANRATVVQLDRTDRDFSDDAGLLWGINYELGNIRRWNLEKTFLLILKWMSIVPGTIQRSVRRPVCRATSVVTNLGTPLERVKLPTDEQGRLMVGDLLVEDVELTVPLRPLTPLGFAVMRYGNRQKINLHFDSGLVPVDVAEQLMSLLDKCLDEWPEKPV